MAEQRSAHLVQIRREGADTALFDFALPEGEVLAGIEEGGVGFVGGQYIIVNTNIPLPGNKIAKRAYSIISSDRDQRRFELAVRRIGSGPGSNFMHALEIGSKLSWSGPWGKFLPGDDTAGPSLVLATDTGITAALGLLQARAFEPRVASTDVVWLVASADDFIPASILRARLPGALRSVTVVTTLPVGHPERAAWALESLERSLSERLSECRAQSAFLSGDGAVLHPIRSALLSKGLDPGRIRLESFFNNPDRKAT
jgi:ferredoxin-NADP reductase